MTGIGETDWMDELESPKPKDKWNEDGNSNP